MYSLAIKLMKIIILGVFPLLLISSAGKDTKLIPLALNGTYMLQLEEGLLYNVSGVISFNTAMETAANGRCFSVLELNFLGDDEVLPHHMEVMVSKESNTSTLPLGNYKVGTVDSFLNPSNGLFAAFSSDVLGEQLYFTKNGNIRITHFCKTSVKGTLSLVLENQVGKTIRIKGDFDAR